MDSTRGNFFQFRLLLVIGPARYSIAGTTIWEIWHWPATPTTTAYRIRSHFTNRSCVLSHVNYYLTFKLFYFPKYKTSESTELKGKL